VTVVVEHQNSGDHENSRHGQVHGIFAKLQQRQHSGDSAPAVTGMADVVEPRRALLIAATWLRHRSIIPPIVPGRSHRLGQKADHGH